MKYKPNNLNDNELIEHLSEKCSIRFTKLKFEPIGEGSWIYSLSDKQNNKYFLKISRNISKDIVNTLVYINNKTAIKTLDYVKFNNGKYILKIKDFSGVVYKYVNGNIVGRKVLDAISWKEVGKLLASIHTVELPSNIQNRTYIEKYNRFQDRAKLVMTESRNKDTGIALDLKFLIDKNYKTIEKLFSENNHLKKELENINLVVTHGDAHQWNLIKTKSSFRYLDWDEVGMTLPEKDLLHYIDKPYWKHVLDGYKEKFPGFSVNEEAISYYRNEWVLQEISDYGERILFENISEQHKNDALKELSEYF